MLNPRHDKRAVAHPLELNMVTPTPLEALAELRALGGEREHDPLRERAAAFAVEEFARRHMEVRDDLAWRASRGEDLTPVERSTLHALDAVLDSLEPQPAPLSREVQEIVRDVLRR